MTNTKLYADGIIVAEEKALIQDIQMMHKTKETLPKEQFSVVFKQLCDKVRNSIGINNVIGLALSEDETKVYIPVFSLPAVDGSSYTWHIEEETGRFYIELKQAEPLELIDLEIKEWEAKLESATEFNESKECIETIDGLRELKKDIASYLELMEEVKEFAKSICGAVPMGVGIVVKR
ncbi:hypothetical protein [Bacillus sp. CH_203]|uniref:hypothetical protein n=1 Tax=Bacillus sp. CH_203 TaxID=2978216 RepID=UPI0030F4C929|nr:hypothetical protein [Bacillus cereus]